MSNYPKVKIGDFVEYISREVELDVTKEYPSVGVKWYGDGVHVHEVKAGSSFNAARFEIKENDIIYNDMWARKGSVAIVPHHLDGAVASSHFPTFLPDLSKVLPKYLEYYFRTPSFWEDCENASRGSTGRNQIKKNTFYAIEIPLPPLGEQRRLVTRIEALAGRIAETQSLRQSAAEETEKLFGSKTFELLKDLKIKKVKIEKVCEVRGGIQKSSKRRPDKNPIRYLTVAHVQRNWIDFNDPRYFEVSPNELELWRLHAGDVLVVEGNGSASQIGRTALFKGEIDDCVHQNHVIRVRSDQKRLVTEFLNLFLNSPLGKQEMLERSRTTSGLYNLSVGRIKDIDVPVPPLDEQRRIVAYLDGLSERVNELRRLQAESQVELDALLPSVLDRAFKGEL